MFIHLDDSLLVEQSDSTYNNIIRAVKNLALAAFESKHILYGDYDVIKTMREYFRHDHDVGQVFNQIYQTYSSTACPKEITYYIKVVRDCCTFGIDEDGKKFGQIPYTAFEDSKSIQECNIVSEDFYDCRFYRHVLDYYKKRNSVNINCKFNDVCGSGDRTEENVRNCVYKNKQITICIVDTDKKYPTQAIKRESTYRKCQNIGEKTPTYKFVGLEVQEIENLIPFNVTDELIWYDENRKNKESFDFLRHNAKTEYVLPYFDIKKGIVNDDLLREDCEYRSFVMVCYYLNPILSANGDFELFLKGIQDGQVVYPHLLKNLLKTYLDYVNDNRIFDIELLEYQQQEWNKIGEWMLNMGCSRKSEAIV